MEFERPLAKKSDEVEKAGKPSAPPEPAPPVAARDDVRAAASPVRCPFCHEDMSPAANDWVVCRACLARHHSGCWNESRSCASCRGTELLRQPPTRIRTVVGLCAALAIVLVGLQALRTDSGRPAASRGSVLRVIPRPPSGVDGFDAELLKAVYTRLRAWCGLRALKFNLWNNGAGSPIEVSLDGMESRSPQELEALRAALALDGLEVRVLAADDEPAEEIPRHGGGTPVRVRHGVVVPRGQIQGTTPVDYGYSKWTLEVHVTADGGRAIHDAFGGSSKAVPVAVLGGEALTTERYGDDEVVLGTTAHPIKYDEVELLEFVLEPRRAYPIPVAVELTTRDSRAP